jgi:hypothetical protein
MDHNKLIAQKAKQALKPLGFIRSGKSRIWYKDNGWWAIVVEFQPSSFSKGTYVNVSVTHFLYESAGWSFHVPNRLNGFASAEDDLDFDEKVEAMAYKAASLSKSLLEKYSNIDAFIDWYSNEDRRWIWEEYYSGVFKSFVGDYEGAKKHFQIIEGNDYEYTWEKAVKCRAIDLLALLPDEKSYMSCITGIVLRTRNIMVLEDYKKDDLNLPW